MNLKSMFLLADSQLLLGVSVTSEIIDRIREELFVEKAQAEDNQSIKAAYLGASNGDDPLYYELFLAAMENIGPMTCRHIPENPSPEDVAFVEEANLILLAGGEIVRGWNALVHSDIHQLIYRRYYEGAILIGVSAGAVILGARGWCGENITARDNFSTFNLVPAIIDVHQDPNWERLEKLVSEADEPIHGIGIPKGGALICHADRSIEGVRFPLVEYYRKGNELRCGLILPGNAEGPDLSDVMSREAQRVVESSQLN